MNREQKTAAVAEIVENINESQAVLVVDYRGLTVTQAAELRGSLRDADATLVVAKNTLTGRAIAEVGESAEPLRDFLAGPTALTYVKGDVAAAAKAITTFAKDNDDLPAFKGGVLDGKQLAPDRDPGHRQAPVAPGPVRPARRARRVADHGPRPEPRRSRRRSRDRARRGAGQEGVGRDPVGRCARGLRSD